jgi:hypothetical protein
VCGAIFSPVFLFRGFTIRKIAVIVSKGEDVLLDPGNVFQAIY